MNLLTALLLYGPKAIAIVRAILDAMSTPKTTMAADGQHPVSAIHQIASDPNALQAALKAGMAVLNPKPTPGQMSGPV